MKEKTTNRRKVTFAGIATLAIFFAYFLQGPVAWADESASVGDGLTATYADATKTLRVTGTGTLDKQAFQTIANKHNDESVTVSFDGTGVISLPAYSYGMFSGAKYKLELPDNLDTSKVTNMAYMFSGATNANPNVANWNTSNVTSMSYMFDHATSANPDVTDWVTSKVTNMAGMFNYATSANPNVSKWDTSNVVSMPYMFNGAISANPNVTDWKTGKNTSTYAMFKGATSANPNVTTWDVSKVGSMGGMFDGATKANPDVSKWTTSSLTVIDEMFKGATSADPDVSGWDTSKVTNMAGVFDGATSANPDVSKWAVSFNGKSPRMVSNTATVSITGKQLKGLGTSVWKVPHAVFVKETGEGKISPLELPKSDLSGLDDGTLYLIAPLRPVEAPVAVEGLVYNGSEQTGVPAGEHYTITDNKATDAGDYEATITPAIGYYWTTGDNTTSARKIAWTIGKKPATVTPEAGQSKLKDATDPTFKMQVSGLVDGQTLNGALTREAGETPGEYAYTIDQLSKDNPNYALTLAGDAKFKIRDWTNLIPIIDPMEGITVDKNPVQVNKDGELADKAITDKVTAPEGSTVVVTDKPATDKVGTFEATVTVTKKDGTKVTVKVPVKVVDVKNATGDTGKVSVKSPNSGTLAHTGNIVLLIGGAAVICLIGGGLILSIRRRKSSDS